MTTAIDDLTVAYVGNFKPAHSTENHVSTAWQAHDADVVELQEDDPLTWKLLPRLDVDMVMWTKTWTLPDFPQRDVLGALAQRGVPTVAFHLDRWWGLDREPQIECEPFFGCDLVITADGGHDKQWEDAAIAHRWLPPAVSLADAVTPGRRSSEYVRDVTFVGSHAWYHPEWPHRHQLLAWANQRYGRRFAKFPLPGRGAVRGRDLANLYASTRVVIGDSCLAGGQTHYWSDRIPETIGRGGFLLHCDVDGLQEHFEIGTHLVTYPIGDFEKLGELIDHYLVHPGERQSIADAGRAHVLEHHTYERRVVQVVDLMREAGML